MTLQAIASRLEFADGFLELKRGVSIGGDARVPRETQLLQLLLETADLGFFGSEQCVLVCRQLSESGRSARGAHPVFTTLAHNSLHRLGLDLRAPLCKLESFQSLLNMLIFQTERANHRHVGISADRVFQQMRQFAVSIWDVRASVESKFS